MWGADVREAGETEWKSERRGIQRSGMEGGSWEAVVLSLAETPKMVGGS